MYANPAVNPYSFVGVDVAIAIADAASPVGPDRCGKSDRIGGSNPANY